MEIFKYFPYIRIILKSRGRVGTADNIHDSLPGEVPERFIFYSFGMQWEGVWDYEIPSGDSTNRMRYNGKEYLSGSHLYDYGARYYAPQIGRWGGVDPASELMPEWSTYNYGFNAPIKFIDPDGTIPIIPAIVAIAIIIVTEPTPVNAPRGDSDHRKFQQAQKEHSESLTMSLLPGGSRTKNVSNILFNQVKNEVKDEAKGVIYKRVDKTGNQKDSVGQSKSEERYQARQQEHKRANPDADYDFEIIDRGRQNCSIF